MNDHWPKIYQCIEFDQFLRFFILWKTRMSKIGKNRRSVSNLEREIYLAINDWIKGQGGGCLLAENQLPTRTTQKSLRFHGLRDGRSESRARETFFFFDDRNWIFRVFESVAIRFVPRCQRPTKLCQVNDWTRSILALEGKNKGEEGEGLIECYYRCVILKGELEAEAWKN